MFFCRLPGVHKICTRLPGVPSQGGQITWFTQNLHQITWSPKCTLSESPRSCQSAWSSSTWHGRTNHPFPSPSRRSCSARQMTSQRSPGGHCKVWCRYMTLGLCTAVRRMAMARQWGSDVSSTVCRACYLTSAAAPAWRTLTGGKPSRFKPTETWLQRF